MLNFPLEMMVCTLLVDVEDALCKCNASYLILEILRHDKIRGWGICISIIHSKFGGTQNESPLSPVIYAHGFSL